MATSDADYRARLEIDRPPAAVLEALTSIDGLSSWWTTATGDGQAGGELHFDFRRDEPLVVHVDAADPSSGVQWTVLGYATLPEWTGTTIRFELTPGASGGTIVAFRHHGLTPSLNCYASCESGWNHFLPSLERFVETGAGDPFSSPADVARRQARA